VVEVPAPKRTVLVVLLTEENRAALGTIFAGSPWTMLSAGTLAEARQALNSPIGVVISENRFPDGQCWKDLLCLLQRMSNPPPLIVADRLADERLWAEALNLGAYDVLAEPFDGGEVRRVVESAWGHMRNVASLGCRQRHAAAGA